MCRQSDAKGLTTTEKEIVSNLVFGGMSLHEIAAHMQIGQFYVSKVFEKKKQHFYPKACSSTSRQSLKPTRYSNISKIR